MPDYDRLTKELAERIAEMLDYRTFEVTSHDHTVVVRALQGRSAGSTLNLSVEISGLIMLKLLPLPANLRLRTYFVNTADALQEFVSRVFRTDWPAPDAKPHASANEAEVHVWYGSSTESEADLRWRPLNRREIGL